MRGHSDEAEDKKLFSKMLKSGVAKSKMAGKVSSHLSKDIKEQKHGIKEDKSLMKAIKKPKK